MRGRLLVIEGVDSSGKATQADMLCARFRAEGINARKISFPDYESQSSALVKMYLSGEFGENARDVGAYAASSFYAVDRFASYKTKWGEFLNAGGTIIADRYTTSNMIHQAVKLKAPEREEFLLWLEDFEYEKLGLPRPDAVFFLNMPPNHAADLMRGRENKATGGSKPDIHERDLEYLKNSYENALYIADKFGWEKISCAGEGLRSAADIGDEIYAAAKRAVSSSPHLRR